jgi:transcriptional regulator with XRE-family HTH domain
MSRGADNRAMTIGSRIKERRESLQISVMELASACQVHHNAVYQWESGDSKGLKPENLVRAAKKLNCRIDWLVFGTGPIERPAALEYLSPEDRAAHEAYLKLDDETQQLLRTACTDVDLRGALQAYAQMSDEHKVAMLKVMRDFAQLEILRQQASGKG